MIIPPDKFKSDINQSSTTVYPLINIDNQIYISQVKESFGGQVYEDHNLKVSNIKQSINFESRKFKISNVTITFSNYAELSDKLSEIDIMNRTVTIYWKTQSCTSLTDCLRVYQANIRRYHHSDSKVTLQLEDNSQEKFKKDVPIANLGESEYVYSDKYINKYIPITYGQHDYAPAIIWRPSKDALSFEVICDDIHDITDTGREINVSLAHGTDEGTYSIGSGTNPVRTLGAHKGVYVDIWSRYQAHMSENLAGYDGNRECYKTFPNRILCEMNYNAGTPLNPFANNEFQASFNRYPTSMEFVGENAVDYEGVGTEFMSWQVLDISNPEAAFSRYGDVFYPDAINSWAEVPDLDAQTPFAIEEDGAIDVPAEFEAWKTANLTEYRALNNYTAEGHEEDIFDFTPTMQAGVTFQSLNYQNEGSIYYDYGFPSSDSPHPDPTDPSDTSTEGEQKFHYAGVDQGIDWVGWRHGDFTEGSQYVDEDGQTKTTYMNRFGQGGYKFPTEHKPSFTGDVEADLSEYKKIGLVIDSTGRDLWAGVSHVSRQVHAAPGGYDTHHHSEDLYVSSRSDDDYNYEGMSPIPRIKYLHAANNFVFIQIPSASKIAERLRMKLAQSTRTSDGSAISLPNEWNDTENYYYQNLYFSFPTDSEGIMFSNQCRPSDPYMGRFSHPYYVNPFDGSTDGSWTGNYVAKVNSSFSPVGENPEGITFPCGNRVLEYYQRGFFDDNFATRAPLHGESDQYISEFGHVRTDSLYPYHNLALNENYGDGYSPTTPYTDGNVHSGAVSPHGHAGSDPIYAGHVAADVKQNAYTSYNSLSGYYPLQGCHYYERGYYGLTQPHIAEMKPYGNLVHIFGLYSNHGDSIFSNSAGNLERLDRNVHKFITVTLDPGGMQFGDTKWHASGEDSSILGCGWGWSYPDTFSTSENPGLPVNQIATGLDPNTKYTNEEFKGFTKPADFGHLNQVDTGQYFATTWGYEFEYPGEINNPPDLDNDAFTLPNSLVTGAPSHYSLLELFDLSELCVVIPFELESTGIDFDEGQNGAFFIRPKYKCYWNGIEPNDVTKLGNGGSDVGSSFTKSVSTLYTGGKERWHMLSLKDMGNYTKAGFLQSCFGAYKEYASASTDIEYGQLQVDLGSSYQYITEAWINLVAASGDPAKGLGIRFKLEDINLSDNIPLAHKCYWQRKFTLQRDSHATTSETSGLAIVATAVDVDRSTGELDVLKTATTKFYETFEELKDAGTTGDVPNPITFNNIGHNNQIIYEGDTTASDLDNDSLPDWDSLSRFGGQGIDGGVPWSNPDDFSTFNMYIMSESDDSGAVPLTTQWNLKLYRNYILHICDFTNLTDSDFYLRCNGRRNGDVTIEHPASVIEDLVKKELNLDPIRDLNTDSFMTSFNAVSNTDYKLAFSIKDKIDSTKLIREICLNTQIFPIINYENKFSLINIYNSYNNFSPNTTIRSKSVLNYKFNKTKLDDVKSKSMVKYDLDYATGEFRRNTGWFSAKDFLGDGDLDGVGDSEGASEYLNAEGEPSGYRCGYYNLDVNEEDSMIVFEAKYIRDRGAAEKLQEFLAMFYCNQHLTVSLDLDVSYMGLEVGDIIEFEELLENVKAYGHDYKNENIINGQLAYPLFMIEEVSKKSNKVSIKAVQLHNLEREFTAVKGDISRNGLKEQYDLTMLLNYVGGEYTTQIANYRYTRYQFLSMDVNNSNSISDSDALYLSEELGASL